MAKAEIRSDSFRELRSWLEEGKSYFDSDSRVDLNRRDDKFRLWLDRGRQAGFLKYSGVLSKDIETLKKRFRCVVRTLALLILVFALATWFMAFGRIFFLIVVCGGVLGSSTAAFISALDRWANGVEDFHGNAYPDPTTKKERFNERFSSWLLFRPILGISAASLIFFGSDALIPNNSPWKPETSGSYAFIGIVAGLFAKTLIKVLLKAFKGLLGR